MTCWPEAVQYLLRSYATSSAIRGAILDLRDTRQRPGETETGFRTRLNTAFYRSGNVHTSEEKATMFVDGLDPVIKTLVEQRREETRRMSYLELVQYARAEGDSNRTRLSANRRSTPMLGQETHSRKRIVRYPRTNCPPPWWALQLPLRIHYWLFKPMSQPHTLITTNGTEACHVTVLVGKRHTRRIHTAEDRRNHGLHPSVMSVTSPLIYHHAARTPLRTERKSSRITSHSPKWSAHECQLLRTSVRKQSSNQMVHLS